MPKKKNLNKVMVIGSGPIIIGQAAEFDYAGSQACRALKEEGLEVVLVNSNPATIMTDTHIADRVYIEPLTVDFCEAIIEMERPDGLLATLGGQAGLNLAVQLAEKGVLEKYHVELLGTPLKAIERAEDRELFKETMQKLGEPIQKAPLSKMCLLLSLLQMRLAILSSYAPPIRWAAPVAALRRMKSSSAKSARTACVPPACTRT